MLTHLVVVMVKLTISPRISCETQSTRINVIKIKSHLHIQLSVNLPMQTTSQHKFGFLNLHKKLAVICSCNTYGMPLEVATDHRFCLLLF